VEEDPGGDRAVERAVCRRQFLHVTHMSVDAARACELDHPWGQVERDELDAERRDEAQRELSFTATDLEDTIGPHLPDGLDDDVTRVDPADLAVDRLACAQPCLALVLATDVRRIVDPADDPFVHGAVSATKTQCRVLHSSGRLKRSSGRVGSLPKPSKPRT
jgi:hypothetical protein